MQKTTGLGPSTLTPKVCFTMALNDVILLLHYKTIYSQIIKHTRHFLKIRDTIIIIVLY